MQFVLKSLILLCVLIHNGQAEGKEKTSVRPLPEMSIGSSKAPVVVINYSSLTCGHCAQFHTEVLPKIEKNFVKSGYVRIIFRDYPGDQISIKAHQLAWCKGEIKYLDFVKLLYETQEKWLLAPDPVAALGRRAGADGAGADLRGVPHQPVADLRAGRSRRAAGRPQRRAVLQPAERDDVVHRDALHHHHAQPDHHGADEPAVRRHHGRARRVAAGLGRSRGRGENPRRGVRSTASPDLPALLRAALEARLQGVSRNAAAERAAAISKTYRDGGNSGAIRSETDALAYALARMPATYAADIASLNALIDGMWISGQVFGNIETAGHKQGKKACMFYLHSIFPDCF